MERRFLALDCSFETQYVNLFIASLAHWIPPHAWDIIRLVQGEKIPQQEIIESYGGVILTGSHCSVNEREEWYDDLILFIQHSSLNGKPKIFGGCFGTQIIAHALGGRVEKNPSKTFLLQPELVELNSSFFQNFSDTSSPPQLAYLLIESHGEYISFLPSDALVLGSSISCPHELYLIGSQKNLLGCQSHPEFTSTFALEDGQDLLPGEEEKMIARERFANYSHDDCQQFIEHVLCPFFGLRGREKES
jgi:GMP synthase-like glutamine amidotransferase